MLAGSRLSNDARFSDPASEQDLAYGIIDLVRPCVIAKAARQPNVI
jgi:hypothetical protein